jgi:flagellar motor protein MotB
MNEAPYDEQVEDFNVWPSFVDLLAATSLLFVTLVAVFIFVAYERVRLGEAEAAGLRTELAELVSALNNTEAATHRVYTVEHDGQFVRLLIQEEATFPHGEYQWHTLRESGKTALRDIGGVLRETSISKLYREVRVIGHSDSVAYVVPSFSNWELSASRAAVVARYLVTYVQVDPCKISATGVGPYYPRDDLGPQLTSRERNAQNRRIEIEIIPARAAGNVERTTCSPYGDGSIPGRSTQ